MTPRLRAFGLGLLFTTGCPRTPASAPPAEVNSPASPPAAAQGGAGGTGGADAPSVPLTSSGAGEGQSSLQGAAQGGNVASPAPVSSDATEQSRNVKAWFCFSWVHGRDFASPCFPKAHACAQAFTKDLHQDKKPCSAYSGIVTCVALGGHAAGAPNTESCFQ